MPTTETVDDVGSRYEMPVPPKPAQLDEATVAALLFIAPFVAIGAAVATWVARRFRVVRR
jgi:hypothetical protein